MPGLNKRETIIDTGYESEAELLARIQKAFNDLRNEASDNPEAAKFIKAEARTLARLLEDE